VTDEDRKRYTGEGLSDQHAWVSKLNAGSPACSRVECDELLRPTPRGLLGVW
jgi:hypothetical protein